MPKLLNSPHLVLLLAERASACKKYGGWWRWALVTSLDGVAPIGMVGVSASVNLLLHHKVQKFSSGTGSPGDRNRAVKWLWWCCNQNRNLVDLWLGQ